MVVVERSTILYMAASDMQQGFNGPFIPVPSRYVLKHVYKEYLFISFDRCTGNAFYQVIF